LISKYFSFEAGMLSTFLPRRLPLIKRLLRNRKNSDDPSFAAEKRIYPKISPSKHTPERPVSFIVVRFSDKYLHNLSQSECIHSPLNELIEVDNTSNLFFDNLSRAVSHGIKQAKHDLIVVVHEDVLLPDRWQSRFEESLNVLEKHDPDWGILGSVGCNPPEPEIGHWSDPRGLTNTFRNSAVPYQAVSKLGGQILIFDKARLPKFDLCLPGMLFLAEDLIAEEKKLGRKSYTIDAPTVHQYADADGHLVQSNHQSEKPQNRGSLQYLANKACSEDYIIHKYSAKKNIDCELTGSSKPDSGRENQLDQPIILLARGGSGSRILSRMAQDLGIFIGNNLNDSGDSLDLVIPIYKVLIEKYRCQAKWQMTHTLSSLRTVVASQIEDLPLNSLWGFKLPESVLILPELESIFPKARYVYFQRDPLGICLRRTHITARLDNDIGQITLPLAYDHADIAREQILADHPAQHMAYTTIHQVDLINAHMNSLADNRKVTIRFEDTIKDPSHEVNRLGEWLRSTPSGDSTKEFVDIKRATNPKTKYTPAVEAKVRIILESLRKESGYL